MYNDMMFGIIIHADIKTIIAYHLTHKYNTITSQKYFWIEKLKHDQLSLLASPVTTQEWIQYYLRIKNAKDKVYALLDLMCQEDNKIIQIYCHPDINYSMHQHQFMLTNTIISLEEHVIYLTDNDEEFTSTREELINLLIWIFYTKFPCNLRDDQYIVYNVKNYTNIQVTKERLEILLRRYNYWKNLNLL